MIGRSADLRDQVFDHVSFAQIAHKKNYREYLWIGYEGLL